VKGWKVMKILKIFKALMFVLALLAAGQCAALAVEIPKKPLDRVFYQTVIVPFDYHDKVFLNGEKTDVFGDYKLYERNGRVLVPIRMMSYLAGALDQDKGYWQVNWDEKNPHDVILTNYHQQKTIKLQVNNTTMFVNNEPVALDVPPQNIEGRVVLPLRSISEALDKEVAWLDKLVILSNDVIDLHSPQTLAIKDKIKEKLADVRKEADYENRLWPVAKFDHHIYYIKTTYSETGYIEELYRKTDNGPEVKIDLPGKENFSHHKIIDNELYYISQVNGKSELHIFSFADEKSRKLCDLGNWNPEDGWISDMGYLNNEFYVILHSGDLTMGWENLYKLENGELKEIADGKSFTHFDVAGDYLYFTVFHPMANWANNLFRINLITGEKENLGDPEFTYGILRKAHDDGSVSYSGESLYLDEENIYTLGHKESDPLDQSSVYKISRDGTVQEKITPPAQRFWLVNKKVYYEDSTTGCLVQTDLEGNNRKTITDKRVIDVKFFNGNIYYTAAKEDRGNLRLGELYKYNIAEDREIKLSDKPVHDFYVGKAGVYYNGAGYELGLYKINAQGKNTCLVEDSLYTTLLTDSGIVYTLRYEDGIYFLQ
jgi:hypothetical protein